MKWQERIVSDRGILLGKPVIKGTRLSVEFILERLANGWSENTLLESYPQLKKEDLQALFAYINEFTKDGLIGEMKSIIQK